MANSIMLKNVTAKSVTPKKWWQIASLFKMWHQKASLLKMWQQKSVTYKEVMAKSITTKWAMSKKNCCKIFWGSCQAALFLPFEIGSWLPVFWSNNTWPTDIWSTPSTKRDSSVDLPTVVPIIRSLLLHTVGKMSVGQMVFDQITRRRCQLIRT